MCVRFPPLRTNPCRNTKMPSSHSQAKWSGSKQLTCFLQASKSNTKGLWASIWKELPKEPNRWLKVLVVPKPTSPQYCPRCRNCLKASPNSTQLHHGVRQSLFWTSKSKSVGINSPKLRWHLTMVEIPSQLDNFTRMKTTFKTTNGLISKKRCPQMKKD